MRIETLQPELIAQFPKHQIPLAFCWQEVNEAAKGYHDEGENAVYAAARINLALWRWKGSSGLSWTQLEGARILDLGAGSDSSLVYKPYFARLCAINGADVVAVDIKPQSKIDQALFTCIQADIVTAVAEHRLSELEGLRGRKFDIIHSRNLIGDNPAPGICERFFESFGNRVWSALEELNVMVVAECAKLVDENGIIDLGLQGDGLAGHRIYRMADGHLRVEDY